MYDVSIVIPVYNHLDLTQQVIKNIEDTQKDINYELIIVNDGSRDSTQKRLEANKKPHWVVINQKNKGTNGAWNAGVQKATAPFIAIINNDILLPENALKDMISGFTSPSIWMVQTRTLTPGSKSYGDKPFYIKNHIHGWCYMISREARDRLFPIDTRLRIFGGDNRLFFKMVYMGYKLKTMVGILIKHLESQTVSGIRNVDRPIFFWIAKEQGWYVQPLIVKTDVPEKDILFGL